MNNCRHFIFAFSALLLIFSNFACSTGPDGTVFVGEWEETRNPEHVWRIEQGSFGTYTGTRIGATEEVYKNETETWKVVDENGILKLVSKVEGGTTISFIKNRNGQANLLRHPPGKTYNRKK